MGLTRTCLSGSNWNFSAYSLQFATFKDGCRDPEDWIKLVMAFLEVENLMPLKEPADKARMFRSLLKGQAFSFFEHHLRKRVEAEDSEVPDNELIELVLRDLRLEYMLSAPYTGKSII
jgi:hypothetical protein